MKVGGEFHGGSYNIIMEITGPVLMLVILASYYFSRLVLRTHPKLKAEEIAKLYPQKRWLKRNYWIWNGIVVAMFLGTLLFAGALGGKSVMFLVFSFVAQMTLLEGIFAFVTHAHIVSGQVSWNAFVYDPNQELRWVALTQIVLAIVEILVCLLAFFGYRS